MKLAFESEAELLDLSYQILLGEMAQQALTGV